MNFQINLIIHLIYLIYKKFLLLNILILNKLLEMYIRHLKEKCFNLCIQIRKGPIMSKDIYNMLLIFLIEFTSINLHYLSSILIGKLILIFKMLLWSGKENVLNIWADIIENLELWLSHKLKEDLSRKKNSILLTRRLKFISFSKEYQLLTNISVLFTTSLKKSFQIW